MSQDKSNYVTEHFKQHFKQRGDESNISGTISKMELVNYCGLGPVTTNCINDRASR